jgi:hypothetical protein
MSAVDGKLGNLHSYYILLLKIVGYNDIFSLYMEKGGNSS